MFSTTTINPSLSLRKISFYNQKHFQWKDIPITLQRASGSTCVFGLKREITETFGYFYISTAYFLHLPLRSASPPLTVVADKPIDHVFLPVLPTSFQKMDPLHNSLITLKLIFTFLNLATTSLDGEHMRNHNFRNWAVKVSLELKSKSIIICPSRSRKLKWLEQS